MKYEWKKQEKEWYGVKGKAVMVDVPLQKFIMISGKGNPNDTDFSDKVGALYALAYAIKMDYKSASTSNEISDFTVYPLEGIWKQIEDSELIKDKLEYTIMIRQPDFINKKMVDNALERVKIKKPNPLYEEINFDTIIDGKSVQILHVGAFDDEPASFEKMDEFSKMHKLERIENYHREIYLNNANRTEKSKLKTILRYKIK
ncbi:GyrI-like domain-containing protein [Listeria seeligeri]|uniref:GyrI-like domain-containing protein n=1 Tax=Listeria seeligeri TaxID=1640 RepID=UPI0010ECE3A9|nr:GyrI-like domain-containing protein [Listeria seeligeri]MBC2225353.1 small molecule-binding protein [Listeria seeligeri]